MWGLSWGMEKGHNIRIQARAHHDAEEGKKRNHQRRKSLEDPQRQQLRELPAQTVVLDGRIALGRHLDVDDRERE